MAKILVADPIAEDGIQALRKCADVDVKIGLAPQALLDIIADYEALVVRSETKVTAAVIERGCKLQVIGRAGVGVDNIDLDAATRSGIIVVNAPAANTISTAEHTIAMMMALARHIPQAHALLKAGQWQRTKFVGTEIRGKILGIVGLGKVGTEVARRARGLEMKVLAFDPFVSTEYARNLGIELAPLERIFKDSDFITVHTPLTADTKGIIGAKEIALMKPTVKLINVARGGIIDEAVLYKALEEGKVGGAAIDVFSKEPAADNILIKSDKVIVTPHLGASTSEAQSNVALDVADQIIAALQGQPVRYAVNIPFIPAESMSVLAPYQVVAFHVGEVAAQLVEGQLNTIAIQYDGEISNCDTSVLKATILRAILGRTSEERVNIVNANIIAANRGIKIIEQKSSACENYTSLITLQVVTNSGTTQVAGTQLRGEPHIVMVNSYWIDLTPSGGYWLFCDHKDRPGLIGSVGNVTGQADINISSMQVARVTPRGRAMMVLSLDDQLPEVHRKKIEAIPDVYSVKVVRM